MAKNVRQQKAGYSQGEDAWVLNFCLGMNLGILRRKVINWKPLYFHSHNKSTEAPSNCSWTINTSFKLNEKQRGDKVNEHVLIAGEEENKPKLQKSKPTRRKNISI